MARKECCNLHAPVVITLNEVNLATAYGALVDTEYGTKRGKGLIQQVVKNARKVLKQPMAPGVA